MCVWVSHTSLCSCGWAETDGAKGGFPYTEAVQRALHLQIKNIKMTDRAAATASFRNIKLVFALTAPPPCQWNT